MTAGRPPHHALVCTRKKKRMTNYPAPWQKHAASESRRPQRKRPGKLRRLAPPFLVRLVGKAKAEGFCNDGVTHYRHD